MALIDPLMVGHRIRHFRKRKGWTLADLGAAIGRTAPHLSLVENGRSEATLGFLNELAAALDVPTEELLIQQAPSRRAELEIRLEQAQQSGLYGRLGLAYLRPSAGLSDIAMEHIVGLYDELRGREATISFTRRQARAANAELRAEMRRRGNYFAEIESVAAELCRAIGYTGEGAVSKGVVNAIADHLGFKAIRVADMPTPVRSITDLHNRVIYVHGRDHVNSTKAHSIVLQTLGHFALDHPEAADFGEFLHQRVAVNYLAGAVMVPEQAAVPYLAAAKEARNLSVEDLKDRFNVSYEMAGHRFTNLATEHLGLRTHFVRSDEHGIIWKAYENNDVPFPRDSAGAIEGQRLCREWGTRRAFASDARYAIHYQYTDTQAVTYWCATFVVEDRGLAHGITTGVRFEDARWFRGWDTPRHTKSQCPDGDCCRRTTSEVAKRWEGNSWISIAPNSHVLAAMPAETIADVDVVDVYEFLDRRAAELFDHPAV